MSLKLSRKKASSIPPLEGGTYMAVCVGVIDIGEQKNEAYNKYENKVILIFEIPSETVEVDGQQKPRWVSKTYTASLNEKSNLSKHLVSWRGRSFDEEELTNYDVSEVLGKTAMIQILCEQGETGSYNVIAGVSGIPKGFPPPEAQSELLMYDMDEPDEEMFGKLPEWIQERIRKSTEYQERHTGTKELDIDDDEPAEKPGKRGTPF